MRVITLSKTIDISTNKLLAHRWVAYSGTLSLCKGDPALKAQSAQSSAYEKQMMSMMTAQFGKQSQVLDFLFGQMKPMIENPHGMTAAEDAAMRTSTSENITRQFEGAERASQNQQFALASGREIPSGAGAVMSGAFRLGQAGAQADASRSITMFDANLKRQNQFSAANVLMGGANMLNPTGYGGLAQGFGSNAINAEQAYFQSQNAMPPWLSAITSLGGAAAMGAGAAMGGG